MIHKKQIENNIYNYKKKFQSLLLQKKFLITTKYETEL